MKGKQPKNSHLEKYKWKPGESGNPNGRPPLPDDVREVKKLTQSELEKVLNDCLLLTKEQLEKICNDSESTMLQLLVAGIIIKGVQNGDSARFEFLLNRLLGKMKDKIELTGPDGGPIQHLHSAEEIFALHRDAEASRALEIVNAKLKGK
jgi:hypothetical protein